MRIDLVYPKINDTKNCPLKWCSMTEKLDGTNLHFVWDKVLGFYAFGTRRDRFDLDQRGISEFNKDHPGLEEASDIFYKSYNHLNNLFKEKYSNSKEIIIFTEFLGENSFAGMHKKDDPKKLILFDVMIDNKFLNLQELLHNFSWYIDDPEGNASAIQVKGFYIPRIIHQNIKFSGNLVEDIRNGEYEEGYGVKEGCVLKGEVNGKMYMVKVKTNTYMQRLKEEFRDDWKNYWE